MLTSILGIRLVLLVGPTVPLPASYDMMEAISNVEVTNDADQGDGFQITFSLSRDNPSDYDLLQSGRLDPLNRVIIGVVMGAAPEVLIDGIITHHQFAPSDQPGMSTLTVTGKDVSIMLDLEEKNESYPNQPDFLIVTQLIGKYAQFGLVPQATPTTDIPIMLQRIPRQQETDLKFIRRMADRNGYVFYIEPLTIGSNKAFWGPENRLSVPQSALTLSMGQATNVKSLHFSQDALAPVSAEASSFEPISKTIIPIPALPSLRLPPLVPNPTKVVRKRLMRNTANQNPAQAATTAIAVPTLAPESVKGEGELDCVRYGKILRARKLVGVRGVGFTYDGLYFVRRVTHSISVGQYNQKFTITREGTGSLTPVLIP
jgi:hypothetical protein